MEKFILRDPDSETPDQIMFESEVLQMFEGYAKPFDRGAVAIFQYTITLFLKFSIFLIVSHL